MSFGSTPGGNAGFFHGQPHPFLKGFRWSAVAGRWLGKEEWDWAEADQSDPTIWPKPGVNYYCRVYPNDPLVQAFGFPDISGVRVDQWGNYSNMPPGVSDDWIRENTNIFGLRPGDTPCIKRTAPPPDPAPDPQEEKKCCTEGELCDGLNKSLNTIAETLEALGKLLEGKYGDSDCSSKECLAEIERIVSEKIEEEREKEADCRRRLEAGLCGSLEYEQECAKYALGECEKDCYEVGKGNREGSCKGCGKDPCCCKEGECVPCPEEEEEEEKFKGWCDRRTLLVYVTRESADPPTADSVGVSLAETEIAALEQAKQFCKEQPPYPDEPGKPPELSPASISFYCNIDEFSNGGAVRSMVSAGDQLNVAEGMARIINATSDIGAAGLTVGDIGSVAQGLLTATLGLPPLVAQKATKLVSSLLGCRGGGFQQAALGYSAFGLHNKLTGVDLREFARSYRYAMNAECRNRFMSPEQAVAAHLANNIGYRELDTHWAVEGYCPESVDSYLQAARSKPLPHELARMKLRGLIDRKGYDSGMRELGYLRSIDTHNLLELHQQLPTLSDIIRLMVRDADDNTLAAELGLDDKFDIKYGRQLKEWSEQQGVPELFAKYAWRAHWTIPSPTQLFEFWHRLRKDPAFGGEAKLWKNITDALIQQDILPFWHKHFEAVSFRPMGRIDIRRSFNIGSLTEAELPELYGQLGYSDDTADKLTKFSVRLRNQGIAGHRITKLWTAGLMTRADAKMRLVALGFPGPAVEDSFELAQYQFSKSAYAGAYTKGIIDKPNFTAALIRRGVDAGAADSIATELGVRITHHPSLDEYRVGASDRATATWRMIRDGMDSPVIEGLLDIVDRGQEIDNIVACQRAIKRRFLTGALDEMEAGNELTRYGTADVRARKMVRGWKCELSTKGRAINLSRLCLWLEKGVIDSVEFVDRAEKMGYDRLDAGKIVEDCLMSISLKRAAEAKKEAKEQAAEDARKERIRKKQLAEVQQAQARLIRAQKQREATLKRRQKALLSATEKMMHKCKCPLDVAMNFAKSEQGRIQSEFGLTIDEALQVLVTTSDEWTGEDFADLAEVISDAARGIQTAALASPTG